MAVTRLKRKAKRNKSKAAARQARIKRLNTQPVIKQVDIEAIKEEFGSKGKATKKAAKKEEAETKEESEG